MVRLSPHLRQNYSIFMWNFKQHQHNLSNNHIQFSNRNLLCKFEPLSKQLWIRPCFYHLFYSIYMGQPIWDPYGVRLYCPYGSHMGAHMGPIWVPYRLLAGKESPIMCYPYNKLVPSTVLNYNKLVNWDTDSNKSFDFLLNPICIVVVL